MGEKNDYIENIFIYTYKFEPIDSRMYIIIKNKEALIIDPCISKDALELLLKNDVKEILVLLTHEHYDHISGVNWLKGKFKCKVLCSKKCSKNIEDSNLNLSKHFSVLFIDKDINIRNKVESIDYICKADEVFEDELELYWQENKIKLVEAPGHSKGSVCIIFNDNLIFTGDTLVNGFKIITRLPGGSRKDYENITLPFLRGIPDSTLIYPGHGESDVITKFEY